MPDEATAMDSICAVPDLMAASAKDDVVPTLCGTSSALKISNLSKFSSSSKS